MVVDAPMLVIDDQQDRRLPELGIRANRVVHGGDEPLALLHVVVRMLVGRQNLAAVVAGVIAVARLDEAVVRQTACLAVADESVVGGKDLRLILQDIHDLQGRALLIVVVDLGGASRLQ